MRFWRSSSWCEARNFTEIVDIKPLHMAAYIGQLGQRLAKPSVKQHLAAIRMLARPLSGRAARAALSPAVVAAGKIPPQPLH